MSDHTKQTRISFLQQRLAALEIDAAMLILARDVFYYTGTAQPCILIVTPNDYCLLVRRALDFVVHETWLDSDKIIEKGSFEDACGRLKELGVHKGRLGLELDIVPAQLFFKIMHTFASFEAVDLGMEITLQRMEKDQEEIDLTIAACRIRNAGHQRVLATLCEG
ncbi:MAG: aminopeptidase P family N-terminal domain-containing protein, partial [Firmicutes bacterium]|nr:aminopeptidase P family N-terminal domain-containing protein [Bacillota bacterium]